MTCTRSIMLFLLLVQTSCIWIYGRIQRTDYSICSKSQEHAFYQSGRGTALEPFVVCTHAQWKTLASRSDDWGLHFKLGAHLDLSTLTAAEIQVGSLTTPFVGVLDGDGKTISNASISNPTQTNVAIFPVANNSLIKNLTLSHISVVGLDNVGTLIGSGSNVTITDVNLTAGSVVGASSVGGLVGLGSGGFSRLVLAPVVNGTGNYVGGFIGRINGNSSLTHVQTAGTINVGAIQGFGGIVGYVAGGTVSVSQSQSSSVISAVGAAQWGGGVLGSHASAGITMDSVRFTGSISAPAGSSVAGILGYAPDTIALSNCSSTGAVSSLNRASGIVGSITGGSPTITDCFSTGNISATDDFAAGILARNPTGLPTITRCYSTGQISGRNEIGGVAGHFYGDIADSYSTGNIVSTGNKVGGLVGSWNNALFDRIERSHATGAVSGTTDIGGLIGYAATSATMQLNDVYARGNVTASTGFGGGLIGRIPGGGLLLNRAYASGVVTAVTAGAFIGSDNNGGVPYITYTASFYDSDSNMAMQANGSGIATAGVSGLNRTDMYDPTQFSLAGWSGTTWNLTTSGHYLKLIGQP